MLWSVPASVVLCEVVPLAYIQLWQVKRTDTWARVGLWKALGWRQRTCERVGSIVQRTSRIGKACLLMARSIY